MTVDLDIAGIEVVFGGLRAVDDVTIHAPAGEVTGLIGPNGAGKTTTFNACTGIVVPAAGSVTLGGRSLDRAAPARRAQLGLGRTFQRMELFESMTVKENVRLGPEALYAGRRPWGQLVPGRHERADIAERADDAIDRCDLADLREATVGNLSTGQRRLVELARAIASRFRFLLLDEPSSGLDVDETQRFGRILRHTVAEENIGILLVEHDMALIRDVCDTVYVLDFGRVIYSGTTRQVMRSAVVRSAYLGSEGT